MATFAPVGPTSVVQLMANQQQRIELPQIDGDKPALRLLATSHASSTAYAFVALGNESVEANPQNSMPIDLTGRKEQFLALSGEPSNIALVMNVPSGAFTICITPGLLID